MCQTYLVAGGYDDDDGHLSTTELLTEKATAWAFSGELPTPLYGLRGANIDGRILMTGGSFPDKSDEIVEFSPISGEWTVLDNMKSVRSWHALSVIKADNVIEFCDFRYEEPTNPCVKVCFQC